MINILLSHSAGSETPSTRERYNFEIIIIIMTFKTKQVALTPVR